MSVTLRDARRSAEDQRWIQAVYPEYLDELSAAMHTGTGHVAVGGWHPFAFVLRRERAGHTTRWLAVKTCGRSSIELRKTGVILTTG